MTLAQSDPALFDSLSKLGPVATGAAAIVALIIGIATVRQRNRADQRDQWWKRAQWALELTLSDDSVKVARGYEVLEYLADSELAGDDEQALLAAASNSALVSAITVGDNGPGVVGDASEEEIDGIGSTGP